VKVKETKGYTSMNKSVEKRNYFLKVALNIFFFLANILQSIYLTILFSQPILIPFGTMNFTQFVLFEFCKAH